MSERSESANEMDIDIKEEFYQLSSDGINYEKIPDQYQSTMSQSTKDIPSSLRCRLCAIQNDDMIDIFTIHETEGNIAEKIGYCLRIVVNESDNLPKRICWSCSEALELCYQFNKIVEEANRQFRAPDKQTSVKLEETASDFRPLPCNSHCGALFDLSIIGTDSESPTSAEEVATTGSTMESNLVLTSLESSSRVLDSSETQLCANNLKQQTSSAQCERGSEDEENLIVPSGTETKKRCFRCMSAGIETEVQVRRGDLRLHDRRLKKKTGYFCSMCKKPFQHLSTLKIHMTVHSNERPWGCDHCKKSFKTKGHLHQHLTVCKNRSEVNGAIHNYLAGATLFTPETGLHIESPTIVEQYKEQSIGLNLRRSLFSASSEPFSGVLDSNETICVNNLTKDRKRRPTTLVSVQQSNCDSKVFTMTCAKSQSHEKETSSARCDKKSDQERLVVPKRTHTRRSAGYESIVVRTKVQTASYILRRLS